MLEAILFYILAAVAILFGFLTVANPFSRSPLNSALSLLCTILALAGLSVLLNAYFIAAAQVIIYAGAVVVLFTFIFMLSHKEKKLVFAGTRIRFIVGLLVLAVFIPIVMSVAHDSVAAGAVKEVVEGTVPAIGKLLVTKYIVPFEAISVLLLAAIVGVVYMSRPDTNTDVETDTKGEVK